MTRPRTRTGQCSQPIADRDRCAEAVATSLQKACGGWLITWSAWRRAFTAFSAITADSVIIDETSVSRLLQRIGDVESAARRERPLGAMDDRHARMAAEIMRDRIVGGDWPSGRKILSADQLALSFGMDRRPVHRALSDLERAGYLRTIPGKGTYVRAPADWPK